MISNYEKRQGKQGVGYKLIIAFIAFALIFGVKAISSKSSSEEKNIRITIVD